MDRQPFLGLVFPGGAQQMTRVDSSDPAVQESNPTRLVVVFPPGLWPYRSPLDRVAWILGQGLAAAISRVPGLVGYASPRGLVDPRAIDPAYNQPIQVFRSLPPLDLVREEGQILGATWAITGRLLVDRKGFEIWLNLLDPRTGDLLNIQRLAMSRERVLWSVVGLLRRLVAAMGPFDTNRITLPAAFPTGSWESLVAFARAQDALRAWRGDLAGGVEAFRSASRAVALDPGFEAAGQLFADLGSRLLRQATNQYECDQIRNAIAGTGEIEAIRDQLQLAHNRMLALAKGTHET